MGRFRTKFRVFRAGSGAPSGTSGEGKAYFIAGQSNALGQDVIANMPSYLNGPRASVQVWYDNGTTASFEDIDPWDNTRHFDYDTGGSQHAQYGTLVGWGAGVEATYYWAQDESPNPVYLIKNAYGGNTIGNWDVGQPRWTDLLAYIAGAKASIEGEGKVWSPQSMLWVQGESDCTAVLAPDYQTNLTDLFTRIRALSDIPNDFKIYIVRLRSDATGVPDSNEISTIQAAQDAVAASDPYSEIIDPEIIGAGLQGDDLHYDANGLLEIGQEWYARSTGSSPNTLYVSKTGDDTGIGSITRPFATVGKAASLAMWGQTVSIAPGDYYEGDIVPANSGAPGKKVNYIGAGKGVTNIYASELFTSGWVSQGNNRWKQAYATEPYIVTSNGEPLQEIGNNSDFHTNPSFSHYGLQTIGTDETDMHLEDANYNNTIHPGTFYHDGTDLWVYLRNGDDPNTKTIHAGKHDHVLNAFDSSKDYLHFEGISFFYSNGDTKADRGVVTLGEYCSMTNCEVGYGDARGLWTQKEFVATNVDLFWCGNTGAECKVGSGSYDVDIEDSNIRYLGEGTAVSHHHNFRPFAANVHCGGWKMIPNARNVTISGYTIYEINGPAVWFDYCLGEITVENNTMRNVREGVFIEIPEFAGTTRTLSHTAIVQRNLIYKCTHRCVYISAVDGGQVLNNTLAKAPHPLAIHGIPRDSYISRNHIAKRNILDYTNADQVTIFGVAGTNWDYAHLVVGVEESTSNPTSYAEPDTIDIQDNFYVLNETLSPGAPRWKITPNPGYGLTHNDFATLRTDWTWTIEIETNGIDGNTAWEDDQTNVFTDYANDHYTIKGTSSVPADRGHLGVLAGPEKLDLQTEYPTTWQTKLDNRYSTNDTLNPVSFSAYAALFSGIGDEFRDPTFGTKIRVADTSINQINSERPHQNSDNTKWFFRTGTNFQFFNNDGTKDGGTVNLDFESTNPTDSVRWHPINPNILFYPKDDHIIYFDKRDSSKTIVATSPNGTLGTGNRRLAGGDGNIAVKVGSEGWILLTHGSNREDAQVLVLGDPDNPAPNDYKIVSHNWTGSAWELQYETWTAGATKWDFPNGSGFDYATLTLEKDGWAYITTVIDGQGTDSYNLSGTKIDDYDGNANHKNEVYYWDGGVAYNAMVKKAVNGTIPPDVNIGDAAIRYTQVNTSANPMTLTVTTVSPPGLDWGGGYNQAGGGQYSSYASNKKCLLAMNSAVEEGATGWDAYYSEIVEIQLDGDASDDIPRRLLHHMIDTFGPVGEQPEVWISNDGTHGFFKTNVGGQLSGTGWLFWFEILERTPVSQR